MIHIRQEDYSSDKFRQQHYQFTFNLLNENDPQGREKSNEVHGLEYQLRSSWATTSL